MLAVFYPELCKASFPFAAVIHSNIIEHVKTKPTRRVPIVLFQGEDDKIIPVAITKQKVSQIGKGLNITLYTYPKLGHDISVQMKMDYSRIIDKMNK